jgi:hypothetical protein
MLWVPVINAASRNLVQRVKSIGQLTFGIFHWKQDCMCITLPRHKGDAGGERVMERHVHCNPEMPWDCFIFWLGVRILSSSSCGLSHFVFGDDVASGNTDRGSVSTSKKNGAFVTWMHKTMGSFPVKDQLIKFDGLAVDTGTHSNRKGGMEDMATTTDGPPICASFLRAGWSLGPISGRYILRDRGGDEYCSRVCAGLDPNTSAFCVLPPRLNSEVHELSPPWEQFVFNYEKYPPGFKTSVPYLVTCVVWKFHTGFILAVLPSTPSRASST